MSDKKYPFNPLSTGFNNVILDKIMPQCTGNEWKVICVAVRQTFGWADPDSPTGRKLADVISLSQFAGHGGMSRRGAILAVQSCMKKGYLLRKWVRGVKGFAYSLNTAYSMPEERATSAKSALATSAKTAHTNNKREH